MLKRNKSVDAGSRGTTHWPVSCQETSQSNSLWPRCHHNFVLATSQKAISDWMSLGVVRVRFTTIVCRCLVSISSISLNCSILQQHMTSITLTQERSTHRRNCTSDYLIQGQDGTGDNPGTFQRFLGRKHNMDSKPLRRLPQN